MTLEEAYDRLFESSPTPSPDRCWEILRELAQDVYDLGYRNGHYDGVDWATSDADHR